MSSLSLYGACSDLFAGYPMAVSDGSMVLLHEDGAGTEYFVLTDDGTAGQPFYSIRRWRSSGDVPIDPGAAVPGVFADAVLHGTPVPRHGSFLGWRDGGETITALVAVYAEYAPQYPLPSWSCMPRAGIPEAEWPPFACGPLLGPWFWEHYQAGRIVSLASLVAANPGAVFWVDTEAVLGWNCCAVARHVGEPEGPVLPPGCYVRSEVLQAGRPVPSLSALLADPSATDLAPRFRFAEAAPFAEASP